MAAPSISVGLPGLSLPGLPPLDFGSSASSFWDQRGASFSASGAGDWNVNVAGSGTATQTASSLPSLPSLSVGGQSMSLLWIAVGLGVVWVLIKK